MLTSSTVGKRSYKQNCALARASDVIGDRWTLLLLRDLLISPRRFKELLDSEQGMGTNLLAKRLKDLEAAGIIDRQEGGRRYALTDRGRALEPAILALIRWGLSHGPENQPSDHHRDDWDLLALKSLFQPGRAQQMSVSVQFESDDFGGWVVVDDRQMRVGLDPAIEPDLRIDGTVKDLFVETEEPEKLLLQGDPATLHRFMSAFALRA